MLKTTVYLVPGSGFPLTQILESSGDGVSNWVSATPGDLDCSWFQVHLSLGPALGHRGHSGYEPGNASSLSASLCPCVHVSNKQKEWKRKSPARLHVHQIFRTNKYARLLGIKTNPRHKKNRPDFKQLIEDMRTWQSKRVEMCVLSQQASCYCRNSGG